MLLRPRKRVSAADVQTIPALIGWSAGAGYYWVMTSWRKGPYQHLPPPPPGSPEWRKLMHGLADAVHVAVKYPYLQRARYALLAGCVAGVTTAVFMKIASGSSGLYSERFAISPVAGVARLTGYAKDEFEHRTGGLRSLAAAPETIRDWIQPKLSSRMQAAKDAAKAATMKHRGTQTNAVDVIADEVEGLADSMPADANAKDWTAEFDAVEYFGEAAR